ncbi:hypothetical protein CT0861_00344 [Colletotrichum tofieldiae]|uniref:Uncharacterized protein n=1 Tax=Colletotrichum tofieldiae TaxID=708197 RepID=A0A166Q5S5_9PEZI|nr:hypothetical protein CT0861_00344 [Colletotrichum tofieldiae]GKT96928.1 hypothetical protein Ct61P_14778 [Colletotrichum tofieldiae]
MAFQLDPVADVRRLRYAKVYSDDREASTNAYWDLENQIMYPMTARFMTTREDYPDNRSNLRFDRTVSRILQGNHVIRVVAGEDKRLGAAKAEIKKAEDDVERKARLVMESEGITQLYCHTTVGTAFRVWTLDYPNYELQPLFGNYTRADKNAYIDIRTSFGQYEWHRLGSLVKNENVLPLGTFEVQGYLVAPADWMYKLDRMQMRLEAEEKQQLEAELNLQEATAQYLYEQEQAQGAPAPSQDTPADLYSQTNQLPESSTQYNMHSVDPSSADQSYPSENLRSSQSHAVEIDNSVALEPDEPDVEPGPSQEGQRRRRPKTKEVTLERRENNSGYKFTWRKEKVKTERNEWTRDGNVLTLHQQLNGYTVWGYKP